MGHGWVGSKGLSSTVRPSGLICLSSQEKIMEMQCELLVSNFKDPKTIAHMKENIKRISDGSSSHSIRALKLGFKKALDLKRKSGNGVLLRCLYSGCTRYTNHISYSTVGHSIYCSLCLVRGWSHHLQCVGCGSNRTGAYGACQNCGKKFL